MLERHRGSNITSRIPPGAEDQELGKIQFDVWLPTGMKKEEIKSLVGEALYDELTQVQLFSFSQPFWDNSTYSLQLFLTIGSAVCGIGGGQPLGSSKEIDRG